MSGESKVDLWWKNAVVYCLDVETFLDSNGDGIGDFQGLEERVDYLAGLGVTCIWLMPFYATPNRDDGYDISDYYSVDPRLGTMGDFTQFMHTCEAHGIKVIADLVVNHTSDQHAWFQSARSDPHSPYRKFYLWGDERPVKHATSLVFPGEQTTNWTFDRKAKQYYFHQFYEHQPDLNPSEPAVREEMRKIVGFWLEQGLAGFRIDAVPSLIDLEPSVAEEITPHEFLKELRAFAGHRKGDVALLGEVNLPFHEATQYFGASSEMNLLFNFHLNQHLYLALARGDPDPLRKSLASLPPIPSDCQWANFLKNHDEATLDQLTATEKEDVFAAFAPEEGMRLYDRGIRRRLPSMLNGNTALIRLAYSLLFSLPGTPVLFYGEEVGMGENLAVPGRQSVRTPMQWKKGPSAGFSIAPTRDLVRPPTRGAFGPDTVNVADQRRDPGSMLNWMERLIRRRKETAEFAFGTTKVLDAGDSSVFALQSDWNDRRVVALHNFADDTRYADLSSVLDEGVIQATDIWSDQQYSSGHGARFELGPHGYRWIRTLRKGQELLL